MEIFYYTFALFKQNLMLQGRGMPATRGKAVFLAPVTVL